MAAVFALILLPLVACFCVFVSLAGGHLAFAPVMAALTVTALGGGVFLGALRLAHDAEGPEGT